MSFPNRRRPIVSAADGDTAFTSVSILSIEPPMT